MMKQNSKSLRLVRNKKVTEVKLLRALVLAIMFNILRGALVFAGSGHPALSQMGKVASEPAVQLEGVSIKPHLGESLDLSQKFQDESGAFVSLGSFLHPGKPLILSPVYFGCRSLCNYHLNGLVEGLKDLDWSAGQKFEVLAVSFDPTEGSDLGKGKKESYMKAYARPGTENGFHFLTGDKENVAKLMGTLGFNYRWNEEMKEWAHPSAAIIISPEGKITRYLPGVYFESRDIKLALNESVKGKLGNFVDQLVLYCFKYDEHKSKFTPYVVNIMKLGGLLMVLFVGAWLFSFWMKTRRQKLLKVTS